MALVARLDEMPARIFLSIFYVLIVVCAPLAAEAQTCPAGTVDVAMCVAGATGCTLSGTVLCLPGPKTSASSLAALSDFAALATAIGLIYAGFKNFRYRLRVLDYVRRHTPPEFIANIVSTQMDGHECWGILCRLGTLNEIKDAPRPRPASDYNFLLRADFRVFNALYASNLDKVLGVYFGVIAATVIWFGALDQIRFPEPTVGDPTRHTFLTSITVLYVATVLIGVLSTALFIRSWKWDLKKISDDFRKIRRICIGTLLSFGIVVLYISFGFHFLPHLWADPWVGDRAITVAGAVLLLCVAGPVAMYFLGEYFFNLMAAETERCVDELTAEIATKGLGSSIGPSDPPEEASGPQPIFVRPRPAGPIPPPAGPASPPSGPPPEPTR